MALEQYVALANVTLASSTPSITISSIPQSYRDLVLVMQIRTTRSAASDGGFVRANGDSGSNYTRTGMYGTGSSTGAFAGTESGFYLSITGASATSGIFDINVLQIMDYSATDKHKTALLRESENQVVTVLAEAQRWANTSAITSLTIVPQVGPSLNSGTTISLYGVR